MKPKRPPKMYFAVIEACPKHGTDAVDRFEGAHIACWVNVVDLPAGRQRAIALIEGSGWFIKAVKEEKIISADDCPRREGGMQYFNQALVDGEVCVIYTFPTRKL